MSTRAEPSPYEFTYNPDDEGLCAGNCRAHGEHVYILCYGRPVMVRDRDYLLADPTGEYPISHYVGYTTQLPIDRVRQHGARSAHYLVAVQPGTERDEYQIKRTGTCPRCGKSLWYFAESPTYSDEFAPPRRSPEERAEPLARLRAWLAARRSGNSDDQPRAFDL
jgi:hypothetical protein